MDFDIILGDKNPELISEWEKAFADLPRVTVKGGNILFSRADALVSPANSFGFMDGGFDWTINDTMDGKIQPLVQDMIRRKFSGEMPVGCAEIVPTGQMPFPYLVCAPTMRTPQVVADSVNAYLSMRAALLAVINYNKKNDNAIHSVAVPGLCTGTGKMPFERCAKQMRAAYDMVTSTNYFPYRSIGAACDAEKEYLR